MKLLTRVFYVLTVAVLLFGCATVPVVVGACDPVVSEVQAIVTVFAPADWQAKIDKYIADGHAACKVLAAVDQVLGGQALTAPGAAPIPATTLDHMRTWRAAHP